MLTMQWKAEREGAGKYHIRLCGQLIPGMIIGGNRQWYIVVGGNQLPGKYKTIAAAADRLVRRQCGI